MSRPKKRQPIGRGYRIAATAGCAVLLSAALFWIRAAAPPEDASQQAPAGTTSAAQFTAPPSSDYAQRVVAFIHDSIPITRQELGEYLIARCGAEKMENLVNRRIIEEVCKARRIEVTSAEVEAALNEDIAGLGVDRKRFVSQVLKGYKKNLYEWKEDVIRPRLLMTKLCRAGVTWTEENVQDAFDSLYGEKIEGRVVVWPMAEKNQADQEYLSIRGSEEAFADKARHQANSDLATNGGKIRPFARHTTGAGMEALEEQAFHLQPGGVTEVIQTPEGWVVFKCDRRLPADTTVNPQTVRDKLVKEVVEKKIGLEMKTVFEELKKQANPQVQLKPLDSSQTVVAVINDGMPITREELGEYLIARYGTERLENLVNRHIIEEACRVHNIAVTPAEIEAALADDLRVLSAQVGQVVDRKRFENEFLKSYKKSLYEWTEDVIRPRLQMTRLCRDQVISTEADVQAAFEAHYGEKVKGRIILWPKGEEKLAFQEFASIRDSEEAFANKARHQASSQLAAKGGELERPITRHSTGNEELEKEAFSLQPSDVSRVIQTPEGYVVFKCDERIPADSNVKLEEVRAALVKEVIEKKTRQEIPRMFADLKKAAGPRQLLKNPEQPTDLAAEVERELPSDYKPHNHERTGPHGPSSSN